MAERVAHRLSAGLAADQLHELDEDLELGAHALGQLRALEERRVEHLQAGGRWGEGGARWGERGAAGRGVAHHRALGTRVAVSRARLWWEV